MQQAVVGGRCEEIRISCENPRRTPYLFSLWSQGPRSMVRAGEPSIADAVNSECFREVSGFVRSTDRQVNTLGENYSTLLIDPEEFTPFDKSRLGCTHLTKSTF